MAKAAKADKSQKQRFIETAKQLGCDQDEEAFRKKLGEIAKAKPAEEPPSRKR
jgi:hypothetical protein